VNANLQVRQGESTFMCQKPMSHKRTQAVNASTLAENRRNMDFSCGGARSGAFVTLRAIHLQMAHLMRVPPWRAWTGYSTASWHNGAFHHRGTATAKSTQMQTRSLLICPLSRSYHHRLQMCSCSHRLHMACFLSDLSLPMVDPSLRPSGRRARGVPTERSRP